MSSKDLKSISADKAATVIIMQPEVHAKDSLTTAILSQAQVLTGCVCGPSDLSRKTAPECVAIVTSISLGV